MGIIYSGYFKVTTWASSLYTSKRLAWTKFSVSHGTVLQALTRTCLDLSGFLVQAAEISSGYFKKKRELWKGIIELTDGHGTRLLLRITSRITPEFCLWGHCVAAPSPLLLMLLGLNTFGRGVECSIFMCVCVFFFFSLGPFQNIGIPLLLYKLGYIF